VPFDREDTLKKAEKLLRQGRLEAAIAEYVRVVEDQPRDWATANALGDLYVRAGQNDRAAAQYGRIAEHFLREGFYPKAGALYKKLLKLRPDDEESQLKLADISAAQGLLLDAKSYLNAVASRRRARGDRAGAAEIVVRLGSLDPADIDARNAAARTMAEMGDEEAAARRYRDLYDDLAEKDKPGEALEALRQAVRLNPNDRAGRAILAKAATAAGDLEGARAYLDRETAGEDAALLMALAEIELRAGQLDRARELLPHIVAKDSGLRQTLVDLAWTLVDRHPNAAFVCLEAAVDAWSAAGEFDDAATVLQEFMTRVPNQVPALLKLIELCVDGGLEAMMYEAQAQLTDAYLATGQAAEARVIAEDLVAREPWERAHIERFRRALVMLKVPDPDTHIAERLSGQAPFTATDPFVDARPDPPVAREAPPAPPVNEAPARAAAEAAAAEGPAFAAPMARRATDRKPQLPPEIDLTGALGHLSSPPAAEEPAADDRAPDPVPARNDIEQVFEGLRKDSRRQSADHGAQHMTLARTYLEMSLDEEAEKALVTASRSPRQRFEACAMLGRLYLKRGDAATAAEWLERAADAPATSDDEARAVLYDLGATLEGLGETARALAVFLELQADAGDYRDVPARADRLARVQTGG
jgi:tetratricopeptide (TPR) repeat protein